jgi:hypothetical protein
MEWVFPLGIPAPGCSIPQIPTHVEEPPDVNKTTPDNKVSGIIRKIDLSLGIPIWGEHARLAFFFHHLDLI